MANKDYYRILGVGEKAGPAEIKKAYRGLAKRYHPDAHPGDKAAEDRFKEISEAYEVLSDPKKKQQYDQLRKFGPGGAGGFDFSRGFQGRGFDQSFGGGFSFEDLGGLGGFSDIFGDIFDLGSRTRQARYGPQRGENLHFDITVPFQLSISGGKTIINLPREEICSVCSGTGAAPGSSTSVCPDCQGRGLISIAQGGFSINRPCPRCYGRGTIISQPCRNCDGVGHVKKSRRLAVKIPAGISDGSKIRLREQGLPGTGGGPQGDVILTVRIGEHQFFRRKGLDIYCQVPVNIVQAVLGGRIRVRTTDGKVELKIPPGTQSGATFRLRGKGVSYNGKQGDQLITVRVTIPKNISEKQKRLLEQFAREGGLAN